MPETLNVNECTTATTAAGIYDIVIRLLLTWKAYTAYSSQKRRVSPEGVPWEIRLSCFIDDSYSVDFLSEFDNVVGFEGHAIKPFFPQMNKCAFLYATISNW